MTLSRDARVLCGATLLTVPTILYGGWTLLGVLTQGTAGSAPAGLTLDETQWALFRAGHAHAGVWVILSLVIQILLDAARLPRGSIWTARISAPAAAVAVAGGFFGLAFAPGFRWLLYLGALGLAAAVVLTGVGLLRATAGLTRALPEMCRKRNGAGRGVPSAARQARARRPARPPAGVTGSGDASG